MTRKTTKTTKTTKATTKPAMLFRLHLRQWPECPTCGAIGSMKDMPLPPSLARIHVLGTALREMFYAQTSPWDDAGMRVTNTSTAKALAAFVTELEELREQWLDAVKAFLSEYPDTNIFRDKFSLTFDVKPVPYTY